MTKEMGFERTASSPPPQALLERLKDYGQEDSFALWDELSTEERELLVRDIEVISQTSQISSPIPILSLCFRKTLRISLESRLCRLQSCSRSRYFFF